MQLSAAAAALLVLVPTAALAAAPDNSKPIPFELHKDVIFIKATMANSAGLDMALDSGTIRTTLDEAVATRIGLDLSLKAQSSGANGMQQISVVKDQTLRLGGVEVTEPLVLAYPLDFLSKRIGRRVDGIIGVELLRKYVVEIDYANHQVRIIAPEAFAYAGRGEAVPVTYAGRLPLVAGLVKPFGKDPIATRFQLDTGGSGTNVVFWKDFIAKHDLLAGARDLKDVQMTGFTGDSPAKDGRLEALQIGGIRIAEPRVRFSEQYQYGDARVFSGNLGSSFFKQFKVVFDLPHDRVIFERPANVPLAAVPFELHKGLVFADVLVNGKAVQMAVDSAAGHPALDLKKATEIGLDVSTEALNSGPNTNSPQPVRAAMNVTYGIGKAQVTEPATVVYSFDFLAKRIDHPVAGVMGGRFFRQYVLALDYPKRELRLYDPASFQPPAAAKVIPLEVTESDLTVRGSIAASAGAKEVEGSFPLDTGASQADVVLWKPCTERGELATKDLKQVPSTAFGGTRTAQQGKLGRLRVGDVVIEGPDVKFTDVYVAGNPSSRACGNIGSKFFERFNVIFDAPHRRLILE